MMKCNVLNPMLGKGFLIVSVFLTSCTTKKEQWFIWETEGREVAEQIFLMNDSVFDFLPEEYRTIGNEHVKNVHVVDLDNDADLDVVYAGDNMTESDYIQFIMNKGDRLQKAASIWGKPINISGELNHFFMDVSLPGYCADFNDVEYKIEALILRDSIILQYKSMKIFHEYTVIPKTYLEAPIDFIIKNDEYSLRITPEVIESSEHFYPTFDIGNVYQYYKRGDKGKALAETTDSTGRVWWYVEMDPQLSDTIYTYRDGIMVVPSMVGWMSSRFLEKVGE